MLFANMSDAQKATCIEKYRYINVDSGTCWDSGLIDQFKQELEAKGFQGVEVRHSGSFGSQGDGASFTFTGLNNELFFKGVFENPNTSERHKNFLRAVKYYGTPNNNYYVHENSVTVRVGYDDLTDDIDLPHREAVIYESAVAEFTFSESKGLARDLARLYDDETSDEGVSQTLEENVYNFNVYDMSIRNSSDRGLTVKEQAALLMSTAKTMLAYNISPACACDNHYDEIRRGHLMAEGIEQQRADDLLEVELSQMVE